jgi:hypothetical protein
MRPILSPRAKTISVWCTSYISFSRGRFTIKALFFCRAFTHFLQSRPAPSYIYFFVHIGRVNEADWRGAGGASVCHHKPSCCCCGMSNKPLAADYQADRGVSMSGLGCVFAMCGTSICVMRVVSRAGKMTSGRLADANIRSIFLSRGFIVATTVKHVRCVMENVHFCVQRTHVRERRCLFHLLCRILSVLLLFEWMELGVGGGGWEAAVSEYLGGAARNFKWKQPQMFLRWVFRWRFIAEQETCL